ncbi:MAG TPA: polymorphic toxin-type HINT domain-containing protein, partial [Tahibacter sp.]|nr:polymorphic toxin-type HINT domain-containing protein [Tahibacter sp.]
LGFYYLRARYMDPGIGRFTSIDPAEGHNYDPPSLHKYLYTPADPVNYVDPSGRSYMVAAGFAANLAISAVTVVNTATLVHDFASGERELGAREIGMAILWAYAGSKAGALFGRLERTLRKAGCLTNSFTADTLVATSTGLRRIDAIRVGDLVLSRNAASGLDEYRPVAAVFASTKVTAMLTVALEGGVRFQTTPEHRVHADGDWRQASDLASGSSLSTADGGTAVVRTVERHVRHVTVYDLSVAGNENFYVSRAKVLVHNVSPCEKAAQALAKAVPSKYCETFKCKEFTQAFEKLLLTKNIRAKRICIESRHGISLGPGRTISADGTHAGVQVGGLVFDNLFPDGIPINDWVDKLGVNEEHFGRRVMKLWFEEIGSEGCLGRGRNSIR